MIIPALLLFAMSAEEAMRVVVLSAFQLTAAQAHGKPAILSETRQPESEYVEAMDGELPDAALRAEMVKPHAPVSLRSVFKVNGQQLTTPQEIESLISDGTPEERVARFRKRFPFGVLQFSAVGTMPHNRDAFVTYEWLTARIDKHGDFQLRPAEIDLIELAPQAMGWRIIAQHSVGIE